MKKILASFARNTVFANILLILLFFAGGMATLSMIRETFPEFSLDMILISVPYPGADPEEVEEGISRKIEEAIEDVEGIKLYTTESHESIGTTVIEVKEDYTALAKGIDNQLENAIEEVMEMLSKQSPPWPKRPSYEKRTAR